MKIIDTLKLGEADPRIKRPLYPVRIVKTWGNVQNAEALLEEKDMQITTKEPVLTTLENGADGEKAAILLDFGIELNGSLRIINFRSRGDDRYSKIRITFGESVSEALSDIGLHNATNDHTPRDLEAVVPAYSDQEIGETGFRFVRIQLESKNQILGIKSILAMFTYRDLDYLGSFECDDELINKIYNTSAYTCHLCLQRFLWEGIKRDRLVWVGDLYHQMLTIKTVFGGLKIFDEAINFTRKTTPLPGWMNQMPPYSLWWINLLWAWYFYTGNKKLLEENGEYAINLIRQIAGHVEADGSDSFNYSFLDWHTTNKPEGTAGVKGLLAMALDSGAKLAKELGVKDLEEECTSKVAAMRKREYNNCGVKQTAAYLGYSGLNDKLTSAELILKNGAVGLSLPTYFGLTIAKEKSMQGALDVMKQFYNGMLSVGATTFWEDFDYDWLSKNPCRIDEIVPDGANDIHAHNGEHCYVGFRHSLCHGWSTSVTAFLAEQVLGIQLEEIGCKKVKICPNLGDLKWAKGTFPTPYGVISVSHEKDQNGKIITKYTAPKEIEVEIC